MQPNSFFRSFCLFVLFGLFPALATAQTRPSELQRDVRPRNCSISGQVTINGQPAANVRLAIREVPTNWDSPQPIRQTADGSISRSMTKIRTDGEGRYQVTHLPPGRYMVTASSNAFVPADAAQSGNEPKTLTLDAGESREKVDFALVRGGVITGQVSDAEGRPVIAHTVRLFFVVPTPDGKFRLQNRGGEFGERLTDDRGVYRIYGLPAGNYALGAGGNDSFSATKYPPVFYPEASEENQAKIIEVKPGKEITDINLRLGLTRKRYEAIGRVVEAETGNPVPNVQVSADKVAGNSENENADNDSGGGYTKTDRQGNFRMTGLPRGKFRASIYAGWSESSDFYAEPTTFEIVDGDVSGVEIKAVRGGAISGTSIVEGSTDPAVKSQLAQVRVYAHTEMEGSPSQSDQPFSHHQTMLKPDGTFLLTGIAPGKTRVGAHGPRQIQLARIERGGVEIKEFIEMGKGEKITDLRFVFSVGSGVIRGQVQVVGGQPLGGGSISIEARIVGNATSRYRAELDDKGRFELTNLPNGEYELKLNSFSRLNGEYRMQTLTTRRVSVPTGDNPVIITYDPNRKQEER